MYQHHLDWLEYMKQWMECARIQGDLLISEW